MIERILEMLCIFPDDERFYSEKKLTQEKLNFVYETQAIKDAARKQ